MSFASESRIDEVVGHVEQNLDQSPFQVARDLGFDSIDTVRRYLNEAGRSDLWYELKNKLPPREQRDETKITSPSLSFIIQKEREKRSSGVKLETANCDNKVKLVYGDWHLTDEDIMWRSLKSTFKNVTAYLQNKDYQHIEIINCGDIVSGTSIYRGQEARNLTNKPHWQTLAGALFQRELVDQILDGTTLESYEIHVVKGNHDQAGSNRGTNLAYYLARDMQAIGLENTEYNGEHYISDNLYCVHGFGASDYRPQSPKFLRTLQKRIHNQNMVQDTNIDRVVHGHTHWANIAFQYTLNCYFDCLGGFQRNKRADLGKLQRPAGMIVYEKRAENWERKATWKPKLIKPDDQIFLDEAEQVDLEFENVERIGGLLRKSYKIQRELGK